MMLFCLLFLPFRTRRLISPRSARFDYSALLPRSAASTRISGNSDSNSNSNSNRYDPNASIRPVLYRRNCSQSNSQKSSPTTTNRVDTREMTFETESEVTAFVETNLHICTNRNIADLMSKSGKVSRRNRKTSYLQQHLPAIALRIKELILLPWSYRDICNVVYGLQCMTESDHGVLDILESMKIAANKNKNNLKSESDTGTGTGTGTGSQIEGREISLMLYGIRKLTSKNRIVKEFLSEIAELTKMSSTVFETQSIGNALYGLQGMNSDCTEVRAMVSALAEKVRMSDANLDGQAIGNALYGLQSMSSESKEVRDLISALAEKVHKSDALLLGQAIGNALYGMQGMKSESKEVLDLVSALANKVRTCKDLMTGQALGIALYGLKGMSSESNEVCHLISELAWKMFDDEKHFGNLDGQAISNALYGLQRMSSDCMEVRDLIDKLRGKIKKSKDMLDGQGLANALYGLQGMSSDYKEVSALVELIAVRSRRCEFVLTGQAVGMVLSGFQRMNSDSVGVRHLIGIVAKAITNSECELNSLEIGMSLYGLQGMSSDKSEVRKLVKALTIKIQESKTKFDSQAVGALYGLQSMNSESKEVRGLISVLSNKILNSMERIDGQGLSNALYGLQGMNSDTNESRQLFDQIFNKLKDFQGILSGRELGNALYGTLSVINHHFDFDSILHMFFVKVKTYTEIFDTVDPGPDPGPDLGLNSGIDSRSAPTWEVVVICQTILFLIQKLNELSRYHNADDWSLLSERYLNELKSRYDKGDNYFKSNGLYGLKSNYERNMYREIWKIFQNTDVSISSNEHLFNIFESDFILRVPFSGIKMIKINDNKSIIKIKKGKNELIIDKNVENYFTINIEVDGIHHRREKKKLFCERKDEYLRSRNVYVYRIDYINDINYKSTYYINEELKLWLLNCVDETVKNDYIKYPERGENYIHEAWKDFNSNQDTDSDVFSPFKISIGGIPKVSDKEIEIKNVKIENVKIENVKIENVKIDSVKIVSTDDKKNRRIKPSYESIIECILFLIL